MKNIIYLFGVMIFTLISCEKELSIDLKQSSPQIVINSKLFEDSIVSANIYRTSLVTERHNNLWYIDTAIVKLYTNNTFIETLTLDSLGKYSGVYHVKSNTDYTITVEVNGFNTATIHTKTLYRVPILRLDSLGTFIEPKSQEVMHKFGICFNDSEDDDNYYMVDFSSNGVGNESTDIYSIDPAISVGKDGYNYPDGTTAYWNFYLTDELFNGREYTFTFCVPQYKVYEGFTVNLSHISKEYFKYIQTYNAQNSDDGLEMFYQAVQVYNNVENGLGIVGALSSHTKRYKYDCSGDHGGGCMTNKD